MRYGKNPYKSAEAYRPKEITVAVLVYIPNLSGYFAQRFDVLQVSLASLRRNTDFEYDLLVFDNGSCPEVRDYLLELHQSGIIQYLILSRENVGVLGAYNHIFAAAPGKYIAYADDDIFYFPHWLSAELEIFRTFPDVGMVSGLPTWQNFPSHTSSTLEKAKADVSIHINVSKGWPQDWIEEYTESIGRDKEIFIEQCKDIDVVRLTKATVSAYATGTHCQFLVEKDVVKQLLPLETFGMAMKNVASFDEGLNDRGYMRLSTAEPVVLHIGNRINDRVQQLIEQYRLDVQIAATPEPEPNDGLIATLLRFAFVRRVVRKLYHFAFLWVSMADAHMVSDNRKEGRSV